MKNNQIKDETMYEYPLSKLRNREITNDDVIFIYAVTQKGKPTTYDRKEELKTAGFIFEPRTKRWGGWITNLEEGKEIINKLIDMKFFSVGFEGLSYCSELQEELEDYEDEIN